MPTIPQLPANIAPVAADLLPVSQSDGQTHSIQPGSLAVSDGVGSVTLTQAATAAMAALTNTVAALNAAMTALFNSLPTSLPATWAFSGITAGV